MSRRVTLSHHTDDSGLLSIDFLVGFMIFMISFIFVITMASGLLVGLSSKSIDYDAVAYRTGVILVEDPGWEELGDPPTTRWEQIPQSQIPSITRLGLALERDTPNILSQQKIDRFFCSTYLSYDNGDYNRLAVFGDYPYHFNITLRTIEAFPKFYSIGEEAPQNYGYIRRVVMIKQPSPAVKDLSNPVGSSLSQQFTINIPMSTIYSNPTTPEYQTDPLNDGINITITHLNSAQDPLNLPGVPAKLTGVQLKKGITTIPPDLTTTINGITYDYTMYNDYDPINNLPIDVGSNSVNLFITPAYLTKIKADQYSDISVNFLFSGGYLFLDPFDYSTATSLSFTPGIFEVKVW